MHGAGIIPYYSDLPTLDMWGLNDAHIAQAPSEDFGTGRAGHERNDYAYVLDQQPLLILPETEHGFALGYPAWPVDTWPSSGIQPPGTVGDSSSPYPAVFGSDFNNYLPMVIRWSLWKNINGSIFGCRYRRFNKEHSSRAIHFQCEAEPNELCLEGN